MQPSLQTMNSEKKPLTILTQWPLLIIALGVTLTLMWVAALVWLSLRLINVL